MLQAILTILLHVGAWIPKAIVERKLPENWKQMACATLLTVLAVVAGYYGLGFAPPPVPEPVFGWVRDPEAVKAVQAELPFKVFADTPAGQNADPLPDHMYLWKIFAQGVGSPPPIKNQGGVGSCVAHGTNSAAIRSYVVENTLKGKRIDLFDISQEVTYGGSRVQIGGGRIRGDGSVGAWAAKFINDYGVVACIVHEVGGKKYDLTHYNESRCRQYGDSGCPSDLIPIAKQHPVEEITLVRTWAEAKKALASGYAIAVCSDQGFTMQRDANGVCRPSGTWAHCMCLDGYHTENGKEYGHIVNSWGPNAHTGPVGWGSPGTEGFWADASVVGRMLGAGDSWAFSSVKGWPKRDLDWFVKGQTNPSDIRVANLAPVTQIARTRRSLDPCSVLCPDFSLAP